MKMRKLVSVVILICFVVCHSVSATGIGAVPEDSFFKKEVIGIIAPYVMDFDEKTVTRLDCVRSIMKLIGVEEASAKVWGEHTEYCEIPFADIDIDAIGIEYGYVMLADYFEFIPYTIKDKDGENVFKANEGIRVGECLFVMLSCLTDIKTVRSGDLVELSVRFGLINKEEAEELILDSLLQNKQFYVLLSRMLEKNRCKYWPYTENSDVISLGGKLLETDTSDSLSYLEYWYQKQEIEFGRYEDFMSIAPNDENGILVYVDID